MARMLIRHEHHVYFHGNPETDAALNTLIQQGVKIMAMLDSLEAEVTRNTQVDESAIALINGLAAKIQQLIDQGADPAKLQALVDSMKGSSDALAAAVAANTPAAPTP